MCVGWWCGGGVAGRWKGGEKYKKREGYIVYTDFNCRVFSLKKKEKKADA